MTIEVTTLARVTALIKGGSLKADAQTTVSQIIAEVSADFEAFLDRTFDTAGTKSEKFDIEGDEVTRFPLKGYPVTSITDVWFDADENFNDSDKLTTTDYTFDESGYLILKRAVASGGYYPQALRCDYVGGMAASTAAFIAAYPDIAGAGDKQVAMLYHRRNDLGLKGVSVGGSVGGSVQTYAPLDFLPAVRKTLLRHRRAHMG